MALSLPPESPPAPRVMTVGAPATRRCRRTGALLQRCSSIFTPTSDWSWLHKALHKPVQNCSSALSESDRMIYIACRKNNNCFFATNYVKYHQHIFRYWTGIRIEQNTRYINFCHFWWLSVSTTSRVKAKVVENWQSVINPEVIGRIVSVLIVTNRKMALYHYHHHFVIVLPPSIMVLLLFYFSPLRVFKCVIKLCRWRRCFVLVLSPNFHLVRVLFQYSNKNGFASPPLHLKIQHIW